MLMVFLYSVVFAKCFLWFGSDEDVNRATHYMTLLMLSKCTHNKCYGLLNTLNANVFDGKMAPARHFSVPESSGEFNSLNSVEIKFETKIAHAKLQSTFGPTEKTETL